MEEINVRYGESLDLALSFDDTTATEATLYVGKPQGVDVIVKSATVVNGECQITLQPEDTQVPLGEYNYQINVTYSDGQLLKFPAPEDCPDDGLPKFTVYEALDVVEVS